MTKNNRIWIYSFIVIGILIMTASSCEKMDTTEYESVTIGTQVWMLKNLNVTTYRNGDAIYNVTDNTEWRNLTTGAYCDYENSSIKADTYGRLYNWYAINDSRNIAPTGWHVATDGEWTTLINYLGGLNLAGGKLKEIGTSHWNTPNIGATNESGFTALPGGYRHYDGGSYDLKNMGSFWSSSEASPYNAWSYYLYFASGGVIRYGHPKEVGFSVRCIKD